MPDDAEGFCFVILDSSRIFAALQDQKADQFLPG